MALPASKTSASCKAKLRHLPVGHHEHLHLFLAPSGWKLLQVHWLCIAWPNGVGCKIGRSRPSDIRRENIPWQVFREGVIFLPTEPTYRMSEETQVGRDENIRGYNLVLIARHMLPFRVVLNCVLAVASKPSTLHSSMPMGRGQGLVWTVCVYNAIFAMQVRRDVFKQQLFTSHTEMGRRRSSQPNFNDTILGFACYCKILQEQLFASSLACCRRCLHKYSVTAVWRHCVTSTIWHSIV